MIDEKLFGKPLTIDERKELVAEHMVLKEESIRLRERLQSVEGRIAQIRDAMYAPVAYINKKEE